MDTLIHQRTSIRCPFSSPGSLAVIAFVPVPQYMNRTMGQFSEAPSFQSLSGLLHCQIEPVLMAGRYLHVLFPGTTDDLVRILNAHSHRFLNDTVDSMINTEQSDLCMKSTLGSDTNQCWLHFLDHLLIIRVTCNGAVLLQTMLCQQGLNIFRIHIAGRCKLQMIIQYCFNVVGSNTAAADQCVFHTYFSSTFFTRISSSRSVRYPKSYSFTVSVALWQ